METALAQHSARHAARLSIVLAVVAFCVPLVGIFAPLGLAPLLIVAGVGVLCCVPPRDLALYCPRITSAVLLGVVCWGAASSIWAMLASAALYKAAQLIPLFAAALVLIAADRLLLPAARDRIRAALILGVGAALVLLMFERLSDTIISDLLSGFPLDRTLLLKRYNRGVTILTILLWPAVYAVRRRVGWPAAVAFAVFAIAVIASLASRTAVVTVAFGLIFAVAGLASRRFLLALAALAAIAVFVGPVLAPLTILKRSDVIELRDEAITLNVLSSFHRLRIWEFTLQRIADKPLIGWGLDAARDLPGGKVESDAMGTLMPLHPHNAVLQVHVELGVIGTFLAAVLIGSALWGARRYGEDTPAAGVMLAAVFSAIAVASLSYGIWQSWWVGGLGLCMALTRIVVPANTDPA